MLAVKDVVVGNVHYRLSGWSATKGLSILTRLVRLVGEPVGAVVGGVDAKEASPVLAAAAKALVSRLDDAEVQRLVKDCLEGVSSENTLVLSDFDVRFSMKLGHLMALLAEVVKFQFADFYEELAGRLKGAFRPAKA